MTGIRMAVGGATLLLLAACAADEPPPELPPPRPAAQAPQSAPARDECGAQDNRSLVGRSRSEIPVPVVPALQRVACSTCPVTQDYNPRRLNFFFDADTGVIREVKCG
ncbi:peptidase inhibitor I78 [Phenylobacterium sp.]|jgi:hypothetical protein|uniref:peptidase inhibitor I78 n=1 Tax=Phenylobacterium sp. TaxID=1871053 RepID=UPI002F3FC3E0